MQESAPPNDDDRELARRAIDAGLFAPGLLADGALRDDVRAPDKYELVRPLGRGGAGEVWLARDRDLDRLVALKFLGDVPPSVLERFRREARYAARLESPSIVRIWALEEADGRPCIAMEYVDGGNLADARLDDRRLALTLREVCSALDHAHAHGIVHRDIKPENVLLDSRGRAYLTDFGIARDLSSAPGATLSNHGQVMGTPASMAPEQARGEPLAVDARTDVYGIGATLYFKLAGRWPFQGETVVDVLHAVIHDEPPFPRSFRTDIPRALEAIALRCLQKRPKDRYPSMRAVIEELDRYLAGSPVASESGPWFKRLVRTIAGPSAPTPRPAPPAGPADDPFWTLGMDVARQLAEWDANVYRIANDVTRTFGTLERIAERLGAFLDEHPDAAWARFYRGMALLRRGRLDDALLDMEQAIDRVGGIAGAHFELGRLYLELHLRQQRDARTHITSEGRVEHLESSLGRLRQAAVAFAEASRLDADLPAWRVAYADAVAAFAADDWDGCRAACDAILAEDADADEVWKLRGDALALGGGDPFPSWERALEIRRGSWQVCVAQARAWIERGDAEAAERAIDRALAIRPDLVEALLLRVALRAGDRAALPERLALVERCVAQAPDEYEPNVVRAELLVERAQDESTPDEERDEALAAALATLAHAAALTGCQNRVHVARTRALLASAERAIAAGRDPSEHLDGVERMRAEMVGRVAKEPPWAALLARAEALGFRQRPLLPRRSGGRGTGR